MAGKLNATPVALVAALARTLVVLVGLAAPGAGRGAEAASEAAIDVATQCHPSGSVPDALLTCRAWITFAPPRPFDPTHGVFPSESELRTSLQALFVEGWRGIVTYSLDGTLAEIPRIAKEVGFTHVIAGLFWNDAAQLAVEKAKALAAVSYVDAYVLGNEGLDSRYTRADLEREIAALKSATHRAVATSESIDRYEGDPTLALLGDWVFANIQPYIGGIRSIPDAVQDSVSKFSKLQQQASGRVVVAKELWWPTCGSAAATEANQAELFRALALTPVRFVWGEYADQFWKTGEGAQGPCWGLHTDRGQPKQAIQALQQVYRASYENYQGLWFNAPAESESGWGINFAHQGDVIFVTWFTYDLNGRAWWLTMTANKAAEKVYTGALLETRGPPFNAVPFSPAAVTRNTVGSGTLTFTDANNGSFTYTVNGISQTKAIVRQVFGPAPTCAWSAQPDLTLATNYQDLWYAAPAESEAGWGVNLAHQGNTIFATWFTYDFDGTPLWLSVTAARVATNVYSGTLIRTTGPPFNAVPFNPATVARAPVGALTIVFANGNSANYAYTLTLPGQPSVMQTKSVTRQVFRTPGTVCH